VRALETAADAGPGTDGGAVRASRGWTDLVLGPDRPTRAVTGLVTGWHDPRASHLLLLEAVAVGYLWHEFGDSALLLP